MDSDAEKCLEEPEKLLFRMYLGSVSFY